MAERLGAPELVDRVPLLARLAVGALRCQRGIAD